MTPLRCFNVFTEDLDQRSDREGYRWRGVRNIGGWLDASLIGASLYDLPERELSFPYHFHHGVEEWLYVVSGAPCVRTPAGERTLAAGELICFPSGPDGAHRVRGPGRVLMLSAEREPSISVYPDSAKLGTRPRDTEDALNFRRSDAVGYWDGE